MGWGKVLIVDGLFADFFIITMASPSSQLTFGAFLGGKLKLNLLPGDTRAGRHHKWHTWWTRSVRLVPKIIYLLYIYISHPRACKLSPSSNFSPQLVDFLVAKPAARH